MTTAAKLQIMVVDDDESIRDSLALVLQASALARPLSPRATHSGGAPTKVCWSVRRLAGKSTSRRPG